VDHQQVPTGLSVRSILAAQRFEALHRETPGAPTVGLTSPMGAVVVAALDDQLVAKETCRLGGGWVIRVCCSERSSRRVPCRQSRSRRLISSASAGVPMKPSRKSSA
jgi:hypothetical protein